MCHCDTQPPKPNWLMWQWITVQPPVWLSSASLLLPADSHQAQSAWKGLLWIMHQNVMHSLCKPLVERDFCPSQRINNPPAPWHRIQKENFLNFSMETPPNFLFPWERSTDISMSPREEGPFHRAPREQLWFTHTDLPLSLLHYTPELENHRIWGMGRNKSMGFPHPQRVPEMLLKAPLMSWAVFYRGIGFVSQLFLGKWDQLQDTTQPCPKVTLTSARPSTCSPFHDSWHSLKSVTSDFGSLDGLNKYIKKNSKAHNLFKNAVLVKFILQALPTGM